MVLGMESKSGHRRILSYGGTEVAVKKMRIITEGGIHGEIGSKYSLNENSSSEARQKAESGFKEQLHRHGSEMESSHGKGEHGRH